MRRRTILLSSLLAPALLEGLRGQAQAADQPAAPTATPFTPDLPRSQAEALAQKPYQAPDTALPGPYAHLTYDQYRALRFKPDEAIWRSAKLPFQMQFFHRGFLYTNRVDIFEVASGRAEPIPYSPRFFEYGKLAPPEGDIGFAGFRLHAPMNRPDYYDEVCSFLGASYFRAVAKGLNYGLSARGLAIKTGDASGEEFPVFKTFWVERPAHGAHAIVVHALLDSPSTSAAYRFRIQPGTDTIFDVECTLFPRVDITAAGIAPLTSMYYFGSLDHGGVDDWRPAVHDSDGLMMLTGRGEQLWRPLANPRDLQISAFMDQNPAGFGLMQRARAFTDYEDLESRYDIRPSLWIEPQGNWGEGVVQLVEIPTNDETHDNIVAAWRPKEPLKAKGNYSFKYRMHWNPVWPGNRALAQFTDVRGGAQGQDAQLFVLDATGGSLRGLAGRKLTPKLELSADKGTIRNAVAAPNPVTGGWRISFELVPGNAPIVEMRALLSLDGKPLTETFLFRWSAGA